MKVTPVTDEVVVTIKEHDGTAKYDGTEKKATGYDVKSISNSLYHESDFTFNGTAEAKGTNAGSYDMEVNPGDFTNVSKNFTNVTFVVEDGKLIIEKRNVKLTSGSDSKVYDGTPLTKDEVTVSGDGFVEGEGASYDVTGSQTNVGSSDNSFTYTLNDGTSADNYDITTESGKLTVTESEDEVVVTIKENSGSYKYDGTEKTVTGYTVESISNKLYTDKDFKFSGDATIKGTDAGSYNMELKAGDFTNTNKNFKKVSFVIVDGTLEIAKRSITLTSASAEKVYDGTALTNGNVTVSGDGFAEGEGAAYDVTGSQTNVGESSNAFTYELNKGTKAGNYDIKQEKGTLKVTPVTSKVTVTITEHSGSYKYDGNEKTVTGYDVTEISSQLYSEEDFTFSGDATVKGRNAGSYDMKLKASDFTNSNANFTNVEFVIVDGTLEIAKRELTVTANDKSAKYTGSEINADADGYTVSAETPVADGETVSVAAINGGQTYVGEYEDELTISKSDVTISRDGADVTANYEIATVPGKLTITGDPIIPEKTTPEVTSNYKLGDEIPFTITVKNVSKAAAKDITVIDQDATIVKGDGYIIDAGIAKISVLASGAEVKVNAVHVVTEADILAGTVDNHATVKAEDKEYSVTAKTDDIEGVDTTLVVEKTSDVAEGTAAELDQVITYTIKVTNKGNVTYKNVVVEDELEGLTITGTTKGDIEGRTVKIDALAVGETVEITATYKVTEADITAGQVTNVATAKADPVKDPKENKTKVPENSGSKTDLTEKSAPSLGVVKEASEPKDGKAYTLGEEVTYTITVTNNGNVTIKNIVVEDTLTGLKETIDELKPIGSGISTENINFVKFTTTHTITQEDILKGTYVNVATAKGTDPSGKPVKGEDEESITPEDINTTLTVEKTSDVEENAKAALGQTIHYTITVKNDGNVDYSNVVVTDKLAGLKNIKADATNAAVNEKDGTVTIPTLAVGQTVTITAEYTVTSEDILKGNVLNAVTAKGDNVPDPKDPDEPKKPEGGDEKKDETDDVNTTLTVEKTSDVEENVKAALGQTIHYTITVKNDGNVDYSNVVVSDKLAGLKNIKADAENATVSEDGIVTIPTLAVDQTVSITGEYTVTTEDILNGSVLNTVTVKGDDIPDPKDPENPKTPEGGDEVEDITEDPNPSVAITKETTSKPADAVGYAEDETITYNIQATNTGNVTLHDVVITDEKTGDTWNVGTLVPNKPTDVYKASYKVTQADILVSEVENTAVVVGTPARAEKEAEVAAQAFEEVVPDNTVTASASVTDPTVKPSSALKVTKTVTSKGSTITIDGKDVNGYRVGDTIEFNIHVENTGNITLNNIVVNDVPTLDAGSPKGNITIAASADGKYTVDGSTATIATLAPKASVDIKASYLVMAGDGTVKGNKLFNTAFATGTSEDPNNPQPGDSSKTDPVPIEPEPDDGNGAMEGSITVTKMITTSDGKTPTSGVNAAIKVGLYDNASFSGTPIAVNTITISNATSGNTVFNELDNTANTTYYVAELDANNQPIVAANAHLEGYGVPAYSDNCKNGINPTTATDTAATIINPLKGGLEETEDTTEKTTEKSSTTSDSSTSTKSSTAAKTGDDTNMMIYWLLLGMAVLAGCTAVVYRKRKER